MEPNKKNEYESAWNSILYTLWAQELFDSK